MNIGQNSMMVSGENIELPVGYRFVPTDEELVIHYLRSKVISGCVPADVGEDIKASSFYNQSPRCHVRFPNGERECYFFIHEDEEKSPRKRNGSPIRIVGNGLGFWKKTGEKTIFNSEGDHVSAIKYQFTYFSGKDSSKPKKTHWRMDEYLLPPHIYAENNTQGRIVMGKLMRGMNYNNV